MDAIPSFNRVLISVGSNIRPEHYIPKALNLIRAEINVINESKFIRTSPVGFANQDDFINGVIQIKTRMNRRELTYWLKNVENRMDRVRTENKDGPRTIDLDIIAWNGKIVDDDVFSRDYLRNAILEIDPQFFRL